ncbi:MAG: DUF1501 domain-containing protein [Planctomycetaceae bacterium]
MSEPDHDLVDATGCSCSGHSRRRFLSENALGLGSVALASLMARDGLLRPAVAGTPVANPLAGTPADVRPRARSVIFLFMTGGPSQMETFDPKPELNRLHGQPVPASFGKITTQQTTEASLLLGCKRTFRQHGESGLEMSDLFPYLSACADDLAVIRSCHGDSVVHAPAMYQMNTGRILMGHPSLGSWAVYGLGSESDGLPAFVVMLDPDGALTGGPPCWGSGFLPPAYQGTLFQSGPVPIPHLASSTGRSAARQRRSLDLLRQLNDGSDRLEPSLAEARAASYELAFRMQSRAPEAVDLSQETAETHRLYGCDREPTAEFGRRCLLARRLVERGVRFVQLYHGGGPGDMTWDAHGDIEENHPRMAGQSDQPIAALLTDLKRRGLLEDTLVICGGEFGRTPMSQGKTGRDHNPFGFTMWMAGGGVPGGQAIGATDAIGLRAVEKPYHVNDLHATILRLLGLDHWNLSVLHNGREERLTDAEGSPIPEITG